ncbi:MAG: MerR family transcriptional regulator [Gemmatimonadales bacterium]
MPRKPAAGDTSRKRHPIQVVVRRTGLSADVLRAWEKRYDVVEPARSDGGRRLYSDEDVELLHLLRRATEGGRSIGQVAELPREALAGLVREDERAAPPSRGVQAGDATDVVDGALADIQDFDARRLNDRLERAMLDLPAVRFLDALVTPLLRRIGAQWEAGTLRPAQEHLASGVLLRTLHAFLAAVGTARGGPILIAATPQGVRHEFGALLAAASAAMAGWDVTYLGADLPAADIASAAQERSAAVVALSVVLPFDVGDVGKEVAAVRRGLPRETRLIVGGSGTEALGSVLQRDNIMVTTDLPGLRAALA